MEFTLFEIHMDDVAFAVSTGDRAATASTDDEAEPTPDGIPRVVFALVPVFVAAGVAAGFLAARRFGDPRTPGPAAAPDDGSVAVEVSTGEQ